MALADQTIIPGYSFIQTMARGGVSAGGSDPFFANVTLLAFNENAANGTTTFTDQSSSPRTLTRTGNTQWSSAVQFSGVNTVLFDGAGDNVTSVANAAFAFGTGDYTVEVYIRETSLAATRVIYELFRAAGPDDTDLTVLTTGVLDLWVIDIDYNSAALSVVVNTQYHVAVCRSGTTVKTFLNGTEVASGSDSHDLGTSRSLFIGTADDSTSGPFTGNMAGFRITKAARYTGTFTPPTLPYPTS